MTSPPCPPAPVPLSETLSTARQRSRLWRQLADWCDESWSEDPPTPTPTPPPRHTVAPAAAPLLPLVVAEVVEMPVAEVVVVLMLAVVVA